MIKSLKEFLWSHDVFRYEDILEAIPYYKDKKGELNIALAYHVRQGTLISIKRYVYAVVPRGCSVEDAPYSVDPFLLASQLASDAVISYHSALAFYGYLHSLRFEFIYSTGQSKNYTTLNFGNNIYKSTQFPKNLREKNKELIGVKKELRGGQELKITSPERTFVDILDRPKVLGYDWEEIARSLDKTYIGNLGFLVDYLILLGSKLTASRVGYFLERRGAESSVSEDVLGKIESLSSKSLVHLDPCHKKGNVFSKRWNLLVPDSLFNSKWEEIF
jgi:predicted transcriptional regulator of viral defense system